MMEEQIFFIVNKVPDYLQGQTMLHKVTPSVFYGVLNGHPAKVAFDRLNEFVNGVGSNLQIRPESFV